MVWEENREAVEVFAACATQWRYAGEAMVRTGLDYAGVAAVLAAHRVKDRRECLAKVRVMEAEALRTSGSAGRPCSSG